jgi:hypothetical protein
MVQLRNLTIDPEQLLDALPAPDSPAIGITTLIEVLRQELPDLVIGNSTRLPGQTPLMNRAAAV